MALSAVPIMIGGFFSGFLSGSLLEAFCSEEGDENCRFIWPIVGIFGGITVVCIILFRSFVEEPSYDPEPFMPCSQEGKEKFFVLDKK